MTKQFWAVIVVVVLIFVGFFAFSGKSSKTTSKSNNSSKLSQHVIGNSPTGVTLVEYGDYQCPYCEQYFQTVKQVQAAFINKVKFQFRNFPIVNAHPNAFAAARAAEAASLQNKFWEMHDALYTNANWQVWTEASDPTPYFNQYAKQLGLNITQFKSDFASSRVNDVINADAAEGTRLGVEGTPTFFLNGKKIDIANSFSAFEKVLNDAINQKSSKNP